MNMTHYMGLLAENQPWNLLIFMAAVVILAETIAITELGILFTGSFHGTLRKINKVSSIIAGLYFTGIFIYLMKNAWIPLTLDGGWHGWIDFTAVTFYLLGIVPLLGMALLDMGLIMKNSSDRAKMKVHVSFVGLFLIVAHVAMIFGMLDPTLGGGSMHHDMTKM
ncbi:DUF6803 family protein [Bacillus sp. B-jedd]|uniref:DUF6803 family protein n=1 Tax=Bacillus sp. B-jedd TaxID=1476857 RepID=UPI00051557BF|nr:DUF6803 family protein [Bacillus sp. B-jedd]CEG27824.1 hypothetical protein BN1002_02696 [Bacillus sp. B-jedd]